MKNIHYDELSVGDLVTNRNGSSWLILKSELSDRHHAPGDTIFMRWFYIHADSDPYCSQSGYTIADKHTIFVIDAIRHLKGNSAK